jgi:hypothetical protein
MIYIYIYSLNLKIMIMTIIFMIILIAITDNGYNMSLVSKNTKKVLMGKRSGRRALCASYGRWGTHSRELFDVLQV